MKQAVLASALVFLTMISFAQGQLDLNSGTIKTCDGSEGEVGTVALRARIQKITAKNGSLSLQIDTQILQCEALKNDLKAWVVVENPMVPCGDEILSYSNFELLVTSDRGDLLSATPLKAVDSQTIVLTSEQVSRLGKEMIEVGSRAREVLIYQGKVIDQQTVVFGSYLVR